MAKKKMKSNKSVAKRFKVTGSGKVKHSKTCRSHLLVKKGKATKKNKFGKLLTNKKEIDKIKLMIPTKF